MLTCMVEGRDQFTTVKCNKYWPDMVGDTGRYGDIQVQLFDQQEVSKEILIMFLSINSSTKSQHVLKGL